MDAFRVLHSRFLFLRNLLDHLGDTRYHLRCHQRSAQLPRSPRDQDFRNTGTEEAREPQKIHPNRTRCYTIGVGSHYHSLGGVMIRYVYVIQNNNPDSWTGISWIEVKYPAFRSRDDAWEFLTKEKGWKDNELLRRHFSIIPLEVR